MGANVSSKVVSPELGTRFDRPCWYHGTEQHFESWQFPPPPKPGEGLAVAHTAVFFAGDLTFARAAGSRVAVVSLSSKANILDATSNYKAAEQLRKAFGKNQVASRTLNASHDYWHNGWKTGAVLRVASSDSVLENYLNNLALIESQRLRISFAQASVMVKHNATRGLIEVICVEAKKLGFDALYGHEIDRHEKQGQVIAQPWLAVFSKGVVTEPVWSEK